MKSSKIILGALVSLSFIGSACNNNLNQGNNTNPSDNPSGSSTSSPSPSSSSGLGIVSSPKPSSDIPETSPSELPPLTAKAPFIIGRPPGSFGGSVVDPSASPGNLTVVASKINGYVKGYDPVTKIYKNIPNATVIIGEEEITANSAGFYSTLNEVSEVVSVSASAKGYALSTANGVYPGKNRDIHLNPIDERVSFNPNTITMEFKTLSAGEPSKVFSETTTTTTVVTPGTVIAKKYPSILSFGDTNNSRFMPTLVEAISGRYRLEVNPVGNNTTAKGQLLIYDIERDSYGKASNPTQMKRFLYKPDITFRVGDTNFPGLEGETTTTTTTEVTEVTQAELLANFVKISAKFHNTSGFSNFVCNAYVVFPNGEKVFASTYSGMPSNISFRLPKITGVSYSLEAHAGNAFRGSDVVINDLKADDSVEAYLLEPPSGLTPGYNSSSESARPSFSWSGSNESRSYQVEVSSTDLGRPFKWEGFSTETSINYPTIIESLLYNNQYRFQVLALDYNFGGMKVLNDSDSSFKIKRNSDNNAFNLKLFNFNTGGLPKGYRVAYDTVLFRTKP